MIFDRFSICKKKLLLEEWKYFITYHNCKNPIENKQIFYLFYSEKSSQIITADLTKCRIRNDNFWITQGLMNAIFHLYKRRYEKQWANTPKLNIWKGIIGMVEKQ